MEDGVSGARLARLARRYAYEVRGGEECPRWGGAGGFGPHGRSRRGHGPGSIGRVPGPAACARPAAASPRGQEIEQQRRARAAERRLLEGGAALCASRRDALGPPSCEVKQKGRQ
jgi:hypothetical protein